jgi:hypothetical protein
MSDIRDESPSVGRAIDSNVKKDDTNADRGSSNLDAASSNKSTDSSNKEQSSSYKSAQERPLLSDQQGIQSQSAQPYSSVQGNTVASLSASRSDIKEINKYKNSESVVRKNTVIENNNEFSSDNSSYSEFTDYEMYKILLVDTDNKMITSIESDNKGSRSYSNTKFSSIQNSNAITNIIGSGYSPDVTVKVEEHKDDDVISSQASQNLPVATNTNPSINNTKSLGESKILGGNPSTGSGSSSSGSSGSSSSVSSGSQGTSGGEVPSISVKDVDILPADKVDLILTPQVPVQIFRDNDDDIPLEVSFLLKH